jgi:hypothetical protein
LEDTINDTTGNKNDFEDTGGLHGLIKSQKTNFNARSSLEILEEKFNASKSFKNKFFNPNKLMKPNSSQH